MFERAIGLLWISVDRLYIVYARTYTYQNYYSLTYYKVSEQTT